MCNEAAKFALCYGPEELLALHRQGRLLSSFHLSKSPYSGVEYNYAGKQPIPAAGLSPARYAALWAANRLSHRKGLFGSGDHRLIWLIFDLSIAWLNMIPNLHQLLLDRLRQQGVNTEEAPALLRDLSKILELSLGIDPAAASSKLQLLGWNGVMLDYQSFQSVVSRRLTCSCDSSIRCNYVHRRRPQQRPALRVPR